MSNSKSIALLFLVVLVFFNADSGASEKISFEFTINPKNESLDVSGSVDFPVVCRIYGSAAGADLLWEQESFLESRGGMLHLSGDNLPDHFGLPGSGSTAKLEGWLEFEIDGDILYPRHLIPELPLSFKCYGDFLNAAVSVTSEDTANTGSKVSGKQGANPGVSIGGTVDIGCNLDMDVNSITLGGVTRTSWPDGGATSYQSGIGLQLDGDTFNVLDGTIRQWALESVELEGYVKPVDPPSCDTDFILVRNNLIPGWECIPYSPANSEGTIKLWAQEVAYDSPAEVDLAIAGFGYVKIDETSCQEGYVPTYDSGVWTCAAIPGGGGGQYWDLLGTSGTTQGIHYLGTSDGTGLDIRVNQLRAVSYYLPTVDPGQTSVPASDHSPNIVAGYSDNTIVDPGAGLFDPLYAVGRTISGGGMAVAPNRVLKDFGSIGGGLSNWLEGYAGVIGGGENNSIGATHCTIAGGFHNGADGAYATVAGGYDNEAEGEYSIVPGGLNNQALGHFSMAAGAYARVLSDHLSTFVWNSPVSPSYFESTDSYQFLINASGGVGIGTNSPSAQLTVNGSIRAADVNGKGYAFYAEADSEYYAIEGANLSGSGGTGIYGYSVATEGYSFGVQGISKSEEVPGDGTLAQSAGVHGRHSPASESGRGIGVWGDTVSVTDGATGVYGAASSGATNGVLGYNSSDTDGAVGVRGHASGAGEVIGVLGQADSDAGWAVYAQGNARVTGDLIVDGNLRPAGTSVLSFGPEYWQARLAENCAGIGVDEFGTRITITGGLECYEAPELDTWLVRQEKPPWPEPSAYWPCIEPGVEGCGENEDKPWIFGGVVRMPLVIPHGVILEAVKVRWAIGPGSPVEPSGMTGALAAVLYARPHGATGWWGYPNMKDALVWLYLLDQNPDLNPTDNTIFQYSLVPPANTVIDNNSYTYFIDVKVNDSVNSLYEVLVEYSN